MSKPPPAQGDRRAAPRYDTTGKLPGQIVVDLDTDVVQITLGGMMLETTVPLDVDTSHGFVLGIADEELEVSGVVRDCRADPAGVHPALYRLRIEFANLSPRQREGLKRIVKRK